MKMQRDKLVNIESWLNFFLFIGIVYIIFSFYLMFIGLGKTIVVINNKNREEIENMLKTSKAYDESVNIEKLDRIEFFLALNDYRFTLFYKNGEEQSLYDDNLENLKEYIEKNGYNKSWKYVIIDILVIFLLVQLNIKRKDIGDKIDYIDEKEM